MIVFAVDHGPVSQGSLTPTLIGGKPGVRYLKADALYEWRAAVARACPIDEPVDKPAAFAVVVTFRLSRPAYMRGRAGILPRYAGAHPVTYPDLDKLVRGVLDALTGRVWADDSQVVDLIARKVYAEGKPGAEIRIAEIDAER